MAKSRPSKTPKTRSTVRNSRTTVSGPAAPDASGAGDAVAEKAAGTQDVASAFAFNATKAAEYDADAALDPPEGASVKPADPIVGASTVSERNGSAKVGSGGPPIGQNPAAGSLDRVRVDSTSRALTTNQGVAIGDNQSSLKAGLRGPTLLEDFILREKITHFDHERIPERIVHARGSAAHGFFECTKAIPEFTRASAAGDALDVDISLEAAPAVLYDALVLPDGTDAVDALRADGRTLEFLKDQYRHCKPILALGAGEQLLKLCGIEARLPSGKPDPGIVLGSDAEGTADAFVAAIAKHRHFDRETDPPRV